MRKSVSLLLLSLVLVAALIASCGPSLPEGCESGDLLVGMVSDVGGLDDASFNENTWEGLARADSELDVCAKFIESQAQADYEKNIT